jgi:hypothetical protein
MGSLFLGQLQSAFAGWLIILDILSEKLFVVVFI